jgi:outer membrane biosynthesis protein TonB
MLPNHEEKITVIVSFSANEKGVIDEVKVLKGFNKIFDTEAVRVIKSIPVGKIYYRRGKYERRQWNFPVVFSEKNRQKYE